MYLKHDVHGESDIRGGQEENQETDKPVAFRLWTGFRF